MLGTLRWILYKGIIELLSQLRNIYQFTTLLAKITTLHAKKHCPARCRLLGKTIHTISIKHTRNMKIDTDKIHIKKPFYLMVIQSLLAKKRCYQIYCPTSHMRSEYARQQTFCIIQGANAILYMLHTVNVVGFIK